MTEVIALPPPEIGPNGPGAAGWEREFRAFRRLLPHLLTTHPGRYVAVYGEQVVDSGDDKLEVALRVLARHGNVPIHVGFIAEEPEPASRSGVRREGQPAGVSG